MIPAARSDGKTVEIGVSERRSCSWKFLDIKRGVALEGWTYGPEQLRSSESHRELNLLPVA